MKWRLARVALAAGLLIWPMPGSTQGPAIPEIGFLNPGSPDRFARLVAAFHEGLSETGFVEGRNVKVEYRWAEGREDRLKELAEDLVRREVAVLAATGGAFVAVAAKGKTATIPILFIAGSNPVELGLVASIRRPGGNATGVSVDTTTLVAKRLELLRSFVPVHERVAMLVSAAPTVEGFETQFVEANDIIPVKISPGRETDPDEYRVQFAAAVQKGARALLVSADPFFTNRRNRIVELAHEYRLPAVYPWREYAAAGGLASYGPSIVDAYRQIGRYAGRILKGANPQTMPVEGPNTFELTINLNAARKLGIELPASLRAIATETIE